MSLVRTIFIHDTNYFICIHVTDLDLNLPEIFRSEISLYLYSQVVLPLFKNLELILFAQKAAILKRHCILWGMLS